MQLKINKKGEFDTGELNLLRLFQILDTGCVIHPSLLNTCQHETLE